MTYSEKNDLKHLVAIGRLYVEQEKVQRILAPSPPLPKQILDLGMYFVFHRSAMLTTSS